MFTTQLIFSNGRIDRIKRHLIFWAVWWVYFALSHAANPFNKPEVSYFQNPVFTLTESVFLILPQIPLAYAMLYWVLPKFIVPKKYALAVVAIIVLWFCEGVLQFYLIADVFPIVLNYLLADRFVVNTARPPAVSFFMALLATNKGAFTITAIAVAFKIAKHWHLKEQRNLQLQKENSEAQLKLLTAQIHPHFLFNTLNNIFSQTQSVSPTGSQMILRLSHMLRYLLAEGAKKRVPLWKELAMIKDYIRLEQVRYGNKLDLHLNMPATTENMLIAPLLLLPFVENCFKHGASQMIANPWVSLDVELQGTKFVMKLMNGKSESANSKLLPSGTGIRNVEERLRLLYPNKYGLQISDEQNVYVVDLWLEVEPGEVENITVTKTDALLYA